MSRRSSANPDGAAEGKYAAYDADADAVIAFGVDDGAVEGHGSDSKHDPRAPPTASHADAPDAAAAAGRWDERAYHLLVSTARELKGLGNDAVAANSYTDAERLYTQGLGVIEAAIVPAALHAAGAQAAARDVLVLASELRSNRSLARLNTGRVSEALKDADSVIEARPWWPKGYQRKATALGEAGRLVDSVLCLEAGIKACSDAHASNDGVAGNPGTGAHGGAGLTALRKLLNTMDRRRRGLPPKGRKSRSEAAAAGAGARGVVDFTQSLPSRPFEIVLSFLAQDAETGALCSRVCTKWAEEAKVYRGFWAAITPAMCRRHGSLRVSGAEVEAWLKLHAASLRSVDLSETRVGDDALRSVARSCTGLTSLSVAACSNVTDAGVLAVASSGAGARLCTVNLRDDSRVSDAAVCALAAACTALTALHLDRCSITDDALGVIGTSCPLVVDLSLCGTMNAATLAGGGDAGGGGGGGGDDSSTTRGAGSAAPRSPGGSGITDVGVCGVVKALTRLCRLKLGVLPIHDASLEAVAANCADTLEEIDLMWLDDGVTESGVCGLLHACRRLHTVVLEGCSCAGDAAALVLSDLPHLTTVNISECTSMSADGISAIAHGAGALERFTAHNVADSAGAVRTPGWLPTRAAQPPLFDEVPNACPGLLAFHVSNNAPVSDATLALVAAACPLLQSLDVSFCERVTSAGLADVLRACEHLVVLRARYLLGAFNDACVAAIASKNLSVVEVAVPPSLSRSIKDAWLTDTGITALAPLAAKLTSLDIGGQYRVTDPPLASLIRAAPRLSQLRASDCERVSDVTLALVARHSPCMRVVDVSGCRMCSNEGVMMLATGTCRDLRLVNVEGCDVDHAALVSRFGEECPARLLVGDALE